MPPTLYCNAALTETHIHTHRAPRHTSISHLCSRVVPEHGDQEHHYFGLLGGSLPNLRGSLQNLRRSLQTTLPRLDGTSSGFLPAALWDVIWEPFPSILGLFWAAGGTWRGPGAPVCRTGAATPGNMLFLLHFGIPLGSLLGPCWDQFSALDALGRALPHILDHFLAYRDTTPFSPHKQTLEMVKKQLFLRWPMWLKCSK